VDKLIQDNLTSLGVNIFYVQTQQASSLYCPAVWIQASH